MSLNGLSTEVQMLIVECLAVNDVYALLCTCKQFHSLLLDHLYQMDAQSGESSALFYAAKTGSIPTLELSLQNGGNICQQHKDGTRPLILASSEAFLHWAKNKPEGGSRGQQTTQNDPETVSDVTAWHSLFMQKVLDLAISPLLADKDAAGSAMIEAGAWGYRDAMLLLMDRLHVDMDYIGPWGTAVQGAAEKNRVEILELLLARGADINARKPHENTPLISAAKEGHFEAANILIKHGADIEARSATKFYNALQAASFAGCDGLVQLLIDRGTNVNKQGGYIGSALSMACINNRVSTVKLPLDHGAELEAKGGSHAHTALMVAVGNGSHEVVDLLLAAGANINADNGLGWSALSQAAKAGDLGLVTNLIAAGASIVGTKPVCNQPLVDACGYGHKEVAEVLIAEGADVNGKAIIDDTPIMVAAAAGHASIVKLLLSKGADPDTRDRYSNALQIATFRGHFEAVKALVAGGADVNISEGRLGRPWWLALSRCFKDIGVFLMENGSDLDLPPELQVNPPFCKPFKIE